MSKVFGFAVAVAIVLTVVAPAQAQDPGMGQRIVTQERAKGLLPSMQQSDARRPTHGILAQERGRALDTRLFQPSGPAPIVVAGPRDGFDLVDAGIGSAAALVVALLGAAALALRPSGRRQRAAGASSLGR
jgi:hypothetical protein